MRDYNILIELIGYASITHLIVDFINYLDFNLPNKPFKCDMCMGYWLSVIPLTLTHNSLLEGILFAGITGVLSDVLYRIKNRI